MRRHLVLFAFLLSASTVTAAVPEYQALRAARPSGRVSTVANLSIDRDAYRFDFRSGTFHFIDGTDGKPFGAVFLGDGSYTLTPATPSELRQLRLETRDAALTALTDSFDTLVILFSDHTGDEIEKRAPSTKAAPDARAAAAYEKYLDWQKKKIRTNLHLRVMEDMLNRPARQDGVFFAQVQGKKYAPALIVIDPLGISNLAANFGSFSGDEVAFISLDENNPGFWYLCAFKNDAVSGRSKPMRPLAHAQHYDITTSIEGQQIDGTTVIRFLPLEEGLRVLPINILPKLKIKSARLMSAGAPVDLGIVQEDVDLGAFARLFHDEVADADAALVFPAALKKNEPVEVSIDYGGSGVLQAYPDGYSVRARESWYPNLGTFSDVATYQTTFKYPKRNGLVAVGTLVDEKVVGGQKIATWKSDIPIRVVGFNYGTFEKISRHDDPSGVDIDIYTDRMWTKMANDTAVDAMNATRTDTAFFGRAPYPRIAVSQQVEWGFGQSWPTLVYLPTLALTTSTERVMAMEEAGPAAISGVNEFVKTVAWHEISHQWWGHEVGWQTYRDQWLSEGFAEFSAALVLQFTESLEAYDKFWEQRRGSILTKRGSISNDQAGPISQGYRLLTRSAPAAAQTMMYEKGAYVLHMIRMMMRDQTKQNPDEAFIAMMKDYVSTYAGKSPSTSDFQTVVERHMTPAMDAAGNHRMDYFFSQWVDGTDIPRFRTDLQATPTSAGKYRISGMLEQDGVSADFRTLVPIYLDFGGGRMARLGQVRLTGTKPSKVDIELALPTAPKRVVLNALHDVLARN